MNTKSSFEKYGGPILNRNPIRSRQPLSGVVRLSMLDIKRKVRERKFRDNMQCRIEILPVSRCPYSRRTSCLSSSPLTRKSLNVINTSMGLLPIVSPITRTIRKSERFLEIGRNPSQLNILELEKFDINLFREEFFKKIQENEENQKSQEIQIEN